MPDKESSVALLLLVVVVKWLIRLSPTERGVGEVDASRLCAEQPGAGGRRCIKECSFQMMRMFSKEEMH
jgi:hypothetical protein